jgi:hypothetical protein
MAPSHIETIDNAALEEINEALTFARLHLGALLRVKNRLRSPLLRLPTEIIVHILFWGTIVIGGRSSSPVIASTRSCARRPKSGGR